MKSMNEYGYEAAAGGCCEGYGDTDWADYILGAMEPACRVAMERHKLSCGACAAVYDEWSRLLAEEVEQGGGEEAALYPSERHYRSLRRSVRRRGAGLAAGRWAARSGIAAAAAAAVVFFILLVRQGEPVAPEHADIRPFDSYVMSEEPEALRVVQATDTASYRLESFGAMPGSGYIWLSGDSSEAFLLLDDLPNIGKLDYQAWATTGGEMSSLGLVKLTGSRGHLHIRTSLLGSAELLSLSAEPLGGSSLPTTEQFVLFLLQKR